MVLRNSFLVVCLFAIWVTPATLQAASGIQWKDEDPYIFGNFYILRQGLNPRPRRAPERPDAPAFIIITNGRERYIAYYEKSHQASFHGRLLSPFEALWVGNLFKPMHDEPKTKSGRPAQAGAGRKADEAPPTEEQLLNTNLPYVLHERIVLHKPGPNRPGRRMLHRSNLLNEPPFPLQKGLTVYVKTGGQVYRAVLDQDPPPGDIQGLNLTLVERPLQDRAAVLQVEYDTTRP